MTGAVARQLLRESRAKGFCGFCFVRGEPGKVLDHAADCKGVRDAGIKRRKR